MMQNSYRIKLCSLLVSLLYLTGCGIVGTSNVVKVLDRVTCDPSEDYCAQEKINDIWDYCLKNGFRESLGSKNVVSSRSITELVQGTVKKNKIITETIERQSESGIVYNDTKEKPVAIEVNIKGYCIGSEYITK